MRAGGWSSSGWSSSSRSSSSWRSSSWSSGGRSSGGRRSSSRSSGGGRILCCCLGTGIGIVFAHGTTWVQEGAAELQSLFAKVGHSDIFSVSNNVGTGERSWNGSDEGCRKDREEGDGILHNDCIQLMRKD